MEALDRYVLSLATCVCWYRTVPQQQGPDVLSADCPAVYVNFYIT